MSEFNPYQPPAVPMKPAAPVIPPFAGGPQGLGGWLLLVGLGLVVSPFRKLADLITQIKVFREDGLWNALTTPGGESYHPLWAPYIIVENAGNMILLGVWIFMAFLFFGKKRAFPRWYVWAQFGSLIFVIAIIAFMRVMRPDLPILTPETIKQFSQGALGVCIWIPYMLKSRRVAATFIH